MSARPFHTQEGAGGYVVFGRKKVWKISVSIKSCCTVVVTSVLTRYYVKSENQLLLCENLGWKNDLYHILKLLM